MPLNPILDFILAIYMTYTKELDPGNENVLKTISDNLPLLEGILTIITVVGSTVGTGVTWLRKQNVKQYQLLKTEIGSQFDNLKTETTRDIKANQEQIQDVKESLQDQITSSENTIRERMDMQKETIGEIKTLVTKIDDKMDNTTSVISRNTARIDGHDSSIRDIEEQVFRKKQFQNKSAIK